MNQSLSRDRLALLALWLVMFLTVRSEAATLPDFVTLAEEYGPAVVNISTTQHKSVQNRFRHKFEMPDLPQDSPLNEFFRRFFGEDFDNNDTPREYRTQSLGSGSIISDDGYLLTNFHVVNKADEITVTLSDRRKFTAKVIGMDKQSDIALLKIDASNLPTVKIGTGSDLKVGEWVLAIGSPFGFDHSVTAGIVSAMGRNLPSENYVPFIQTDVAINPGNSGGPLINLKGEVVGINSQIYSKTGGFMGLSFAIPIEMAMNAADQLRDKGRVSRGWLGVMIQDVTHELADSFGLPQPTGALVSRVLPDSPAEKAGVRVGDIILKFNDRIVHNSYMLPPIVGVSRVDRAASIQILRDGKEKSIKIKIGELPTEASLAQAPASRGKDQGVENRLGLVLSNITEEMKERYELETTKGVLVEEVHKGAGQEAGIQEGDIIQMINNIRVKNVKEFDRQLKRLPRGTMARVLVIRQSGAIFLPLRVPK